MSGLAGDIYRLLLSDHSQPVNVGNPQEIVLQQFAEEVQALTGTRSKIIYEPLPQNDPQAAQAGHYQSTGNTWLEP